MKIQDLPSLIACLLLFGCGDPDTPNISENKIDVTLDYRAPSPEEAAYQTFYKPANGETGDPMPLYSEAENMFYIYFLLEIHSNYPKGGVYLTKTKDFAQFQPVSMQIPDGNRGDNDESMGTGSCIKKGGTYHFFYTGFNSANAFPSIVTKATANDLTGTWSKVSSLALNPPSGYERNEFRDPCVYWDDTRNKYVMLVGSRRAGKAMIARFQSDDLNEWQSIEGITAVAGNPQKFEIETDTDITECPDIFKMGGKWYLVFSRINRDEHRKTFYRMADHPDGPWRVCGDLSQNQHHETFDGLWLYAAKTVSDGTNRYVSGWASSGQERQSYGELGKELPWGGMLVTHQLVQQPDGKLYPAIPDAVNAKFSTQVAYKDIKTEGNVSGSDGNFVVNGGKAVFNRTVSSVKIEMQIDASQAAKDFGIAFGAYDNQEDAYRLTFDMTSGNRYGQPAVFMYHYGEELNFTPLIVPESKLFDVKIIMERQLCTMYINGNVAFTNRISNMEQNPWMIFADEGAVGFSDIKVFKQ
jgi:beta-fructofuranosidase